MVGARCRMHAQRCWVQCWWVHWCWMCARCCWVLSVAGCVVQDACTALLGAQCCWVHGAECVHSIAGCRALVCAWCRMRSQHWWVHSIAGCSVAGCTVLLGAQCMMHARHCWMRSAGWAHGIAGCSVAGCTVQDARTALVGAQPWWVHSAGCMHGVARCTALLGARCRALYIGRSIPTAGCQIPPPTQEAVGALGAVQRAGPAGGIQSEGWRRKSRSAPSRQRHPGTQQTAFEEAERGIGRDVPGRTACSWPRCESSRNGRHRANAAVALLGVPGVRRAGMAAGCCVWGRAGRGGGRGRRRLQQRVLIWRGETISCWCGCVPTWPHPWGTALIRGVTPSHPWVRAQLHLHMAPSVGTAPSLLSSHPRVQLHQ